MDENRTLGEFIPGSGDRSDGESDLSEAGDVASEGAREFGEDGAHSERPAAEASDVGDGASPVPINATYRWSADGDVCGVCGERVESRWHSGEAFVCVDCKEW